MKFRVAPSRAASKREIVRARRGAEALTELWSRLPQGEWQALFEEVVKTLEEQLDDSPDERTNPLTKRQAPAREKRARVRFLSLLDRFVARARLLEGALTAPQVAELLGSSRQTPLSRAAAGALLAVMDRGAWRFPAWQFDPEGPDGVVEGLSDVLRALDGLSPFAKLVWLSRPNPYLEQRRPIDALRAGDAERVVAEASSAARR
jgi:phytoene dehydrogenase-like protein